MHLDENLLIASPVWSEELDEVLPYLQEERIECLSQLDMWSCKLDVSREGNKIPRASSEGMLVLQR